MLAGGRGMAYAQFPKLERGAPDAWVKTVSLPKEADPKVKTAGGVEYLLLDKQLLTENDAAYSHVAYRISNVDGIQSMSDLSVSVDPSYQKLRFHFLRVHRGGKIIDALAGHEFESFRSESQSDRYLYNGSITHRIHIKDIRVGDVVEYAYTRSGINPGLGQRFCEEVTLDFSMPLRQHYFSVLTPSTRPLKIRNSHMERAKVATLNEGNFTRYIVNRTDIPAVKEDPYIPSWYSPYQQLSFSEYNSWAEVVQWALPYYRLDATHLAKMKDLYRQPLSKENQESVLQAIRFVQEEVRYLGFEMGESGYKPNAPEQVFRNRFGDCKDKSLLLAAILQSRGIEAYPMLVHTETGLDLPNRLPSPLSFNHCIVYISILGREIFVDPTIAYQRGSLYNLYCPPYHFGLILREGERELYKIPPPHAPTVNIEEYYEELDRKGAVDYRVVTEYNGSEADRMRASLASSDEDNISELYLTFYRTYYPQIEQTQAPEIEDDEESNRITVTENYHIPGGFFTQEGTGRKLAFEAWYFRTHVNASGPKDRTSPYSLGEPVNLFQEISVRTLDNWAPTHSEVDVNHFAFDYSVSGTADRHQLEVYFSYVSKQEQVMLPKFPEFYEKREEMDNAASFSFYEYGYEKQMGITQQQEAKTGITVILSFLGGSLVFIFSVLGAILAFIYYNPKPQSHDPELAGISGWLVFVAIGLTITPIFYFVDVISGLVKMLYYARTDELTVIPWRIASFLLDIVLLALSMLLTLCFYSRRSNTPGLFKIMLVLWALATCANFVLAYQLQSDSSFYAKEFFRVLVLLVLWMPFFIVGDQVRATFVKTLR